MAKPFKLSETIKKTGMGRLKRLALLDYTIRKDIIELLKGIGLDDNDILDVSMFIKYNDENNTLEIKISGNNSTVQTFLKINRSIFETTLLPSKYSLEKLLIKL